MVVVNHSLHAAARRAEALGWRYQAHRRGLEQCSINLTTTKSVENVWLTCLVLRTYPEASNTSDRGSGCGVGLALLACWSGLRGRVPPRPRALQDRWVQFPSSASWAYSQALS